MSRFAIATMLALMGAASASCRRVSAEPRSASTPALHGQGYRVIFRDRSSRDLRVLSATTAGTNEGSPVLLNSAVARGVQAFDISPNGACLAVEIREGNRRTLQILSLRDLTAPRKLAEFQRLRDPRWDASGRNLTAVSNDNGRWAIAYVDLAHENVRRLDIQCSSPVIGPGGDYVACEDAANVLVIGRNGETRETLQLEKRIPNFQRRFPMSLDVSADGGSVIFAAAVADQSLPWHEGVKSEIYVWDRRRDNVVRVSPPDVFADSPRWGDGGWLFVGFRVTLANKSIIKAGGWPETGLYVVSGTSGGHIASVAPNVDRYTVSRGAVGRADSLRADRALSLCETSRE